MIDNADLFFMHVGAAVHNWANYVSTVQRGYVLAENSIIYPVSELVGTQSDEVYMDLKHPDLVGKRIDLRFITDFIDGSCECGMEFKYARSTNTGGESEQQRIFNDLVRLKLFVDSKKGRRGYFLMCGEKYDFLSAFQGIVLSTSRDELGLPIEQDNVAEVDLSSLKPTGIYAQWFKFNKNDNDGETDFFLFDTSVVPNKLYQGFRDSYEKKFESGMTMPSLCQTKLKTRLLFISDYDYTPGMSKPMRVGVWEISSER
jgi:hypothetical protein